LHNDKAPISIYQSGHVCLILSILSIIVSIIVPINCSIIVPINCSIIFPINCCPLIINYFQPTIDIDVTIIAELDCVEWLVGWLFLTGTPQ
jgi:hypothetical protein